MSHYQTPCSHGHGYQEPLQTTERVSTEKEGSGYLKMLTNMANDLDQLLTDLGHKHPLSSDNAEDRRRAGVGVRKSIASPFTLHPGEDTLGKDSFLSTSGPLSSTESPDARRHVDSRGSIQSLLSSSSDNNLSADSGHDERTQGTCSPLVFDPHHLAYSLKTLDTACKGTMTSPLPVGTVCPDTGSHSSGDLRPISLMERLATTHSIWLLSQMSRAGAVHLLKDRATGVFIIRKSSQAKSLALSVQNRLKDRANVDHYLIETTDFGMRLQGSAHYFPSIPSLLAHYMEHLDELPYYLSLPDAILEAKSSRELSSLALLGQDFWQSLMSRGGASGALHKSTSEPVNIRHPTQSCDLRNTLHVHTLPLHPSYTDFPSFREQQQMFKDQLSAQMVVSNHSIHNSRRLFVSPTVEPSIPAQVRLGPHVLRLQGSNDTLASTDSSGEEGATANRPHLQLLGTRPRSHTISDSANSRMNLTSLRNHLPQVRPNLYSLEPMEVYQPPDNSYFRSNLSDKMSDYEDIWRSSYYDSDSVRNGSVRGADDFDAASAVTARSEFSKFFAIGGSKESSPLRPVSVRVTSVDNEPQAATQPLSSPATDSRRGSLTPKPQNPFGRLSRLKSSSESSLTTVASPVYADPVDAIVFRKHPNRSSQSKTRRLSVPSIPSEGIFPHSYQRSSHADLCVAVEESLLLPSSDSNDHPDYAQPKKLNKGPKKESSVDPEPADANQLSVSQYLNGIQDMIHQVMENADGKEQVNLSQPEPKALDQETSPYSAVSEMSQPQSKDSPVAAKSEDPVTALSPHRFPVYQQSKQSRTVHRASYFSESTTIQDIIARAMPELIVRPGHGQKAQADKPLSEYDNFNPYAPASASSMGTVFCKPWEGGMADTLIRSSKTYLPPAMNLQERVLKWQEANQTFHQLYQHGQHQQQQQEQRKVDTETSGFIQRNVTKSANSVQIVCNRDNADGVTKSSNVDDKNTGSGEVDEPGRTMPQPRRRLLASPRGSVSSTASRPQSMYYQPSRARQGKRSNSKLTRSLSQPGRSSQKLSPSISDPQQQVSPCRQEHFQHTCHSLQRVVEAAASSTAYERAGLSSNCPDVINCHHVETNVRNSTMPDGKPRIPSAQSIPQSSRQQVHHYTKGIGSPGGKIKEYIHKLSRDHSTIFGGSIENFIQCTLESQDRNPHHVMSNVRQFMTGIKNYLVKHGEGHLEQLIETERGKLGTNEILNIDGLIETTLHVCVLRPLQQHIYSLLVDFHGRNSNLELMSRNIRYARTKTAEEIGIKAGLIPPPSAGIKGYLDNMQLAFSPLEKLENLLKVTSAICSYVKVQGKQLPLQGPGSLGADDFLPLLIYVLVHCGLVSAEIEADYMWGLLHPSVLTGEGGYYLTTLSSAVLLLKNFQKAHESKTAALESQLPTIGEVQGFLKIAFPDELRDTIVWKTLPVRPNMTAKDVCAMIAHKFKFTNPQDYGLVILCDGEESQLEETQCPQILKRDKMSSGKQFFFAYKRLDANIAWPCSVHQS